MAEARVDHAANVTHIARRYDMTLSEAEQTQLRAAADEIARLTRVVEIQKRAVDRYVPCPDCRDKVPHGECQRCARQRAEAKVAALEAERDAARRFLHPDAVRLSEEMHTLHEQVAALEAERDRLRAALDVVRAAIGERQA